MSDQQQAASRMLADRDSRRISVRLKLFFAILSCLGGLVLATGENTESIPVLAIFFAVFGFVFVDWLELFALPPIAAYAAMAMAALYCVSDFSDLDTPGNRQMVAVAQLLVFVQAILMLQRKSRRILEQLGVFCLLELIVAAVFNDALYFGLLLIPISIVGIWALSLMSVVSAWEGVSDSNGLANDSVKRPNPSTGSAVIAFSAPDSVRSMAATASRLPRVALFALTPAVIFVAIVFFYGLPRTADATRMSNRSQALVGFSETMRLGRIGRMMQSSATALRIYTREPISGRPYRLASEMYLRGKVLERYQSHVTTSGGSGSWSALALGPISAEQRLPREFQPSRAADRNFYDSVSVEITCESMKTSALFAVAPYHRRRIDPDIVHSVGRWTIRRRNEDEVVFERMTYSFVSNAFRDGVQTDLIARYANPQSLLLTEAYLLDRAEQNYIANTTEFDIDLIPSAATLAVGVTAKIPASSRTDYRIAKALEQYLASSGLYSHTLDLTFEQVPGLDAIEQFLSVDRKGHCQYFSAALVMMLRSQGIPARVVVGYRTDEYNEIGQYYVARQLHAHAWVEALIDADQLPETRVVYGQPSSEQYWLRLDPTPGGSNTEESDGGGVTQVIDLAQNMWDDYVVEMDSQRQQKAVLRTPGLTPMSDAYTRLINAVTGKIAQLRAGDLGGGALASGRSFSWPAAVMGIVLTLAVVLLLKIRAPNWIRKRIKGTLAQPVARPSVDFYAETLDQLARVGVSRRAAQTPTEVAQEATDSLRHPTNPSVAEPLTVLTHAFYQTRFGTDRPLPSDPIPPPAKPRQSHVNDALNELTRRVDRIQSSSRDRERER